MSIITQMLMRLFPKTEFRVLIVGLDAAGKTTCLYKMKLGEVVTTIPTIGFNVETVEYKSANITMWDVGGCDKIRPLWRHYFQGTDVLVCVIDSNDRDRIEYAREELMKMLNEDELRDSILLVWANKQDLPNAMATAEVTEKLGLHNLRQRQWMIFSACATTGDGLYEGLDWVVRALRETAKKVEGAPQGSGSSQAAPKKKETEEEREKRHKEEMLVEWLEREDNDDDEFLQQLATYTLDTWDHRTHLRIAWLLLTRHGRQEGLPKIFQGIKDFIEHSDRTQRSRGTTFHETMTYFWVHMVHYAMAATQNPTADFKGFLLMNPQLSNGGLFLHYYTKELMLHSPAARTQVVMPDKVPLPSLITSTATSTPVALVEERFAPAKPMDDATFLERFHAKTLPSWGHEAKIRAIWCLLREHGRQRGGTDKLLQALQQVEGPGFNTTMAYFWIHMVTLASAKSADCADYRTFVQQQTNQQLLNPDLITKHYSKKAIDKGISEMTLPDKKPLPNVVR